MILWGYFRSSAAYRVRIALNFKGLAYDNRFVHLARGDQFSPEFHAVNPQEVLPVLELDDGARLRQSMAILEWLEETHPEPPLLPGDRLARAEVRATANIVACDVHPINNLRILKYLRGPLGQNDDAVNTWYRHWVMLAFEAIEELIGTDGYCHGGRPSLADVCLVPQIFNARRFNVDMDPYPRVRAVEEVCGALPAFAAAHPSLQPDAE